MLAIGRGLMTNPDCLIMDEPSEGLAPIIIQGLWEAISKLKQEGLSILLVEQNAHLALKLVDYVHVMAEARSSIRRGLKSRATTKRSSRAISAFDRLQTSWHAARAKALAQSLNGARHGRDVEQIRRDCGAQARQTGTGVRPKSVTIDMHAHAAFPEVGKLANPHLDISTVPLAHFASQETKDLNARQEAGHPQPHHRLRRTPCRHGSHGRRHAARHAGAAAALLHGQARHCRQARAWSMTSWRSSGQA